jgi:hypothetical protein
MDLMVAPCCPIKLRATETSLVANKILEIGHYLTSGCSLFYCLLKFFGYEEGRRKTWNGGTMQQFGMCALNAFSAPKIDAWNWKREGGGEGKTY